MPCLFKCALIKVPWALLLNRAKVSAQIINLSCFPVHLLLAFLHLRWLTRIYLVETNSTLEVQVPSVVLNVISFLPPILWNMTIPHSYFQFMLWVSQSYTHFLSRWIILGDAQHSQRLSVTTLWLSFLFPVSPATQPPPPTSPSPAGQGQAAPGCHLFKTALPGCQRCSCSLNWTKES